MLCEQCEYIYDCPMYEEAMDKNIVINDCEDFTPELSTQGELKKMEEDTYFNNIEQIIGG